MTDPARRHIIMGLEQALDILGKSEDIPNAKVEITSLISALEVMAVTE